MKINLVVREYGNTFTSMKKGETKKGKKPTVKIGGSFKAQEEVIIAARKKAFNTENKTLSKKIEEFLIDYTSK